MGNLRAYLKGMFGSNSFQDKTADFGKEQIPADPNSYAVHSARKDTDEGLREVDLLDAR